MAKQLNDGRQLDHSWLLPIPLVKSNFVSLWPEHRKYNVQTELGAIKSFGQTIDDIRCGAADQQLGPVFNIPGRGGSGRAVFYRNAYLKGVGRTLLAGNWNDQKDFAHASGHLYASAAIREYFVSKWLETCQLEHTIVNCRGLLLKPLNPDLRTFNKRLAGYVGRPVAIIDQKFQAISVKDADFLRGSNLLWILAHSGPGTIKQFFSCLEQFLPGKKSQSLAERLNVSFWQGLGNFFSYIKAGIVWGSVRNNFTLDGRFLDLELPLLMRQPRLGYFGPATFTKATYLEPMQYIQQMGSFYESMLSLLALITLKKDQYSSSEIKMVHDFLGECRQCFGPRHPLTNPTTALPHYVEKIQEIFSIPRSQRKKLRTLISASTVPDFKSDFSFELTLTDFELAAVEPGAPYDLQLISEFNKELDSTDVMLTNNLNSILKQLDSSESSVDVFKLIKTLPREFKRLRTKK